ncbi:MAG: aspartate-semialdehyde dehydrogenase [Chloroflexi bacterium]|uniref:Aspartate-semialdehyde dehydrogenase n=1 Tax=Candidatus Thermofonsia Clade 3 bacterium TaxID=2364212 RepID=A0A2M8QBF7_9CHLR|nr:aspartate-semialdehyde dehydrogenase [Candidatus Roseilinea sp. NK_OTU-006]PJF47138.1 MAG: aspartate-semialdehyde dehydrogenase [Candidatus Thermofonsia Clade 3 bacterium]RMG65798.1 MAG: aspartate-semialdehyde dehydrogenase [Chloroflexota bacterium]
MSTNKVPVAILGATGVVGARFVQLLRDHPTFRIAALAASDRSEGKRYADAAHWVVEDEIPQAVRDMPLLAADPDAVLRAAPDVRAVFSALPNEIAAVAEPAFAQAGVLVFSNASYHRMAPDVPLVIPEVNAEHLNLLRHQRQKRGWMGGIVCNTNCTVSGPAMTLRPLYDAFGVRRVFCVSMQAISGAGYPGVPSLDITDNVLPYIKNEEEKLEAEARKLLGRLDGGAIREASFGLSAHCNRVPVIDGHMVTMSVETERPVAPEEAARVMRQFRCAQTAGLPSAPDCPIIVHDEPDRPQPRRDRLAGSPVGGMSVVVGRVRREPLFGDCGVKFVTLAHNTIRGAAGGSVLNAELAWRMGLMDK